VASPPPYLALSSNANYANGVNFASGGAGVLNSTNKVRQSSKHYCHFREKFDLSKKNNSYC
jgi:hypothetical protein